MRNRFSDCVTWFSLGLLAGVVIAIPAGCQPSNRADWHITTGGRQ